VARMTVAQGTDIYGNVMHLLTIKDGFDHVHWQLDLKCSGKHGSILYPVFLNGSILIIQGSLHLSDGGFQDGANRPGCRDRTFYRRDKFPS